MATVDDLAPMIKAGLERLLDAGLLPDEARLARPVRMVVHTATHPQRLDFDGGEDWLLIIGMVEAGWRVSFRELGEGDDEVHLMSPYSGVGGCA